MTDKKQDCYSDTDHVYLWLSKMKFYCSTKKFEGKQEAYVIASKLEGTAFLVIARLAHADQDNPKEVKEAVRKEFDKEAIDHEKAVDELPSLKRKRDETPAQLAWRIEKLMRKAYPDLCTADNGAAKKTHRQMLQFAFLASIDDAMCTKIKSDTKYRDDEIGRRIRSTRASPLVSTCYRPSNSTSLLFEKFQVIVDKIESLGVENNIICDLNCNVSATAVDNNTKHLLDLSQSYQYTQLIKESTRVTSSLSTLIDLFLTNEPNNFTVAGVNVIGISDHNLIYAIRKHSSVKSKPITIQSRNFKCLNETNFKRDIESVP